MEQAKIERLNELAHKARHHGPLTQAEQAEQHALRQEYLDAIRANLRATLDHTYVVDEEGHKTKLERKVKKPQN